MDKLKIPKTVAMNPRAIIPDNAWLYIKEITSMVSKSEIKDLLHTLEIQKRIRKPRCPNCIAVSFLSTRIILQDQIESTKKITSPTKKM